MDAVSTNGTTVVPAYQLLHGYVRLEELGAGWVRPHRLTELQERQISSVAAWHPGTYRQMAQCTAGITVEFSTSAETITLEVDIDVPSPETLYVLSYAHDLSDPWDGISCDCDGQHLDVGLPAPDETEVTFELGASPEDPQTPRLPGFGTLHHVRIWLPSLIGCAIRNLRADGFVEPVEARPSLLVLGDSISQGFIAGDPAWSWPAILARKTQRDLVNQALGGQVVQPGSLGGMRNVPTPDAIVVEFGANYRYEPCAHAVVERDIHRYLSEIDTLWHEVPTWVMTPIWHDEDAWPTHPRSCYWDVAQMLACTAEAYEQMRLVDGLALMDADAALMADGFEHPNRAGAAQIAERLLEMMHAPAALSGTEKTGERG